MSNADNIENNGSCHIWWDKSNTGSATCGFKKGSSGSLVAYFGSSGDFTSLNDITGSNLETSNGWIIGNNAPLWITESSSSGDLVSFRKGGNEKVLIKGDGEVVLSDSATISSAEMIKVESSSTAGLVKFRHSSSDKISITTSGELVFFDSCTLRPSTSTPAGTAITIEGRGTNESIVNFRNSSSTKVLSVEYSGDLKFSDKFDLYEDDESVISADTSTADLKQIAIGLGDRTKDSKIKGVIIGNGLGSYSSPNSVLSVYPEDNGGAFSLNKGTLDVGFRGYVQTPQKSIWVYVDDPGAPTFRFNEEGTFELPVLSAGHSLLTSADGAFWVSRDSSNGKMYLNVYDSSTSTTKKVELT